MNGCWFLAAGLMITEEAEDIACDLCIKFVWLDSLCWALQRLRTGLDARPNSDSYGDISQNQLQRQTHWQQVELLSSKSGLNDVALSLYRW